MRPPITESDEARTGVPGFRSWKSVYGFVIGTFLLWLALLTWLTFFYA